MIVDPTQVQQNLELAPLSVPAHERPKHGHAFIQALYPTLSTLDKDVLVVYCALLQQALHHIMLSSSFQPKSKAYWPDD
ncbi:hypothetical protein [Pajaroellobacter abortibovis]|uniref:hypothetical protein n=1 Tax=Pajaroellobacter abortibovis TaxID=1882918 RepID=UPI0012EC0CFA|nr:hypothetical protein [Pajaroellobacter abortibovis]